MESLKTIGIVMLIFVVLPSLDVIKGVILTNCFCVIPGLLSLLSRHSGESGRAYKTMLDFISLVAQITGLTLWPLFESEGNPYAIYIPLVATLISLGWWENYVDKNSPFQFIKSLAKAKETLQKSRYFIFIFMAPWKIILIIVSSILCRLMVDGSALYMFTQFKSAFSYHKILIVRDRMDISKSLTDTNVGIESEWLEMTASTSAPLWAFLVQVAASWLCYVFGKFACKICIQRISFAVPLSVSVTGTMIVLTNFCVLNFENGCSLNRYLPRYLFWSCPNDNFFADGVFYNIPSLIWVLMSLSQLWITFHIFAPKCERLATTEKLFINPMYDGVIIDQSMIINRRRDDKEVIKSEDIYRDSSDGLMSSDPSQHYETISEHPEDKKSTVQSTDHITKILACATMWHETTDEMIQVLKSLMRMDEDQCARRNAQKYLSVVDPDYYEFEGMQNYSSTRDPYFLIYNQHSFYISIELSVHIIFDDAFELSDDNDDYQVVNRFVRRLVDVIDTAASYVHQTDIRLHPPNKYPTPYGGLLEYTLPGGNKLYVHMKDKLKIRHRKRWSQVSMNIKRRERKKFVSKIIRRKEFQNSMHQIVTKWHLIEVMRS